MKLDIKRSLEDSILPSARLESSFEIASKQELTMEMPLTEYVHELSVRAATSQELM